MSKIKGNLTPDQLARWRKQAAALFHHKAPDPSKVFGPHDGGSGASDGGTQLTPAQRAYHLWLDQEAAPGLTNREVMQSTNAATRLKYGETSADLAAAQRQNTMQAHRTTDWFSQYQKAINAASQQQAANTQAAVGGVQNLQQGLDQASQKAWAGQQQQMADSAASRGATVDPQLADVAHNASNVRNVLTNSYGAMLLSQGTNAKQGLDDRKVTARQQGLEQLGRVAQSAQDLARQKVRLAREKGDFKTTYGQTLKSSAVDNALKQYLATGTKVKDLASAKQSQASASKTAAETAYLKKYGYLPSAKPNAIEQAKLDYFNKHGYFPPTGPPKKDKPAKKDPASGPGSLTPATEQRRVSQVRTISSLFRNGVTIKDNTGAVLRRIKGGDVAAIRKYLLTEKTMDPLAVQIGLSLYTNDGKLGRGGVDAAHQYGIHVGGNFGIAHGTPKPKPVTGTGGGAGAAVGSQL